MNEPNPNSSKQTLGFQAEVRELLVALHRIVVREKAKLVERKAEEGSEDG